MLSVARWQNFSIWRGRLPHWRADDVNYYVTFRHRRALAESECSELFAALLKQQGRKWEIELLCVLPEKTEIIVRLTSTFESKELDLSDIVEKAKSKAGKAIIRRSGERFPPFYTESYDRIVRDDDEMGSLWESILNSIPQAGLGDDPDDYRFLWTVSVF